MQRGMVFFFREYTYIFLPPSLEIDFTVFFFPRVGKKKPSKKFKKSQVNPNLKIWPRLGEIGVFCEFTGFLGIWDGFFFPTRGKIKNRQIGSSLPIFRTDRQNCMCTPGKKKPSPFALGKVSYF